MIVIPVIIGAFALGGAFDFFNMEPKRMYPIFDYNEVQENLEYHEVKKTDSAFKIVESAKEVFDFLDIEHSIRLKAMNGEVGINGFGPYLNQVVDRSKTIEVLTSYKMLSGIEAFSPSLEPVKGWQEKPPHQVGTHFIQSIEYGGHLLISVQFRCTKVEYVEDVKAVILNKIGKGGSYDSRLFERLAEVIPDIGEHIEIRLNVYSTAGPSKTPTQLAYAKQLIEEFPAQVEKQNGGKGYPMRLVLEDLHKLQPNFPEFKVSREIQELLGEVVEKYEDLRVAFRAFRAWTSGGLIWTPEQEEKINEFELRLKRALRAMIRAISGLDITGSTSQFDEALKAYDYDGEGTSYHRYTRELRVLIKSIEGNSLFRSVYSSLLAIQDERRP